MHKCFKYTSVVSLVFVSLLQACGGGGSGGGGSVQTSAAQSSGVTNGVVSGFGSVLVDGNEIEDAKASVVAENADGTFSNTVLQLGQRVRVDHDGKATASKVTVDATLIGTISLVNSADQTIKIAGQVAGINSDLSKGALTVWAGGYNSFSDLAVNDTAQIHGSLMYDSNTRAYKVTATRIQKMASMASLKVSGKITDINITTKTFKLNELTVAYANSSVRPAAVTLADGMLVTAFALPAQLSGNRLTPDHLKINRNQDGFDKVAATQIGGLVSVYDARGKTFELQGAKVVFTENTKFTPSASALNNNAYVTASGTFSAEGLLNATSIQIRQQNNSTDLAKVKLMGPISQFEDSSSFVVRGVPVDASYIDLTKACPSVTLANEVPVEIDAVQQANTPVVLATQMKCIALPTLAIQSLTGTVNSVDRSIRQFVLAKDASSAPANPVLKKVIWNEKTTFMGMDAASLSPSASTIRVEGYMSGDSLIAKVVNTTGAGLDDDKFQKQSPNNSSAWNDYKQGKQQAKWGTGEPLSMSFNEVPSADYESGRLLNTPTPDFRVTGLYAPPGATLTVKVEGTRAASSNLKLLVGTYSRYNNAGRDPVYFTLNTGTNTLSVGDFGGLVYVQYTVYAKPNPANLHPVTITFQQGFLRAPNYVLGETTKADWKNQLSKYSYPPDVVMQSSRTIMVFSRTNALAWQDNDQDMVLNTADQVLDVEDAVSGLDGSSETHRRNTNQFLMTQAEDGWMYATNFRTAFSADAAKFAFTPLIAGRLPDSGNSWGVWHELGHLHQQPWTWSGLGEVTVNIYSMAAKRALGVTPAGLANNQSKNDTLAYLGSSSAGKNFNTASISVWVKFYMFYQLWQAFGDNFYQQLHRQTREEKPRFTTDAEKMRYFMLKACVISGKDLTAFFKKWGLQADAVYTEIAALHLPAPTTDPSLWTE